MAPSRHRSTRWSKGLAFIGAHAGNFFAQLIKHAFGLAHTFKGKPTSLLYLYWEPANPEDNPAFAAHRAEIAEFAERVAGATPSFSAMRYPEFWSELESAGPAWVQAHLAELRQRYLVQI